MAPLQIGILSERRVFAPQGLNGGEPAARGRNILRKADGRVINLGGKNSVAVDVGDVIDIFTPGGGGYGHRADRDTSDVSDVSLSEPQEKKDQKSQHQ